MTLALTSARMVSTLIGLLIVGLPFGQQFRSKLMSGRWNSKHRTILPKTIKTPLVFGCCCPRNHKANPMASFLPLGLLVFP
jgi:hypothetical protein